MSERRVIQIFIVCLSLSFIGVTRGDDGTEALISFHRVSLYHLVSIIGHLKEGKLLFRRVT